MLRFCDSDALRSAADRTKGMVFFSFSFSNVTTKRNDDSIDSHAFGRVTWTKFTQYRSFVLQISRMSLLLFFFFFSGSRPIDCFARGAREFVHGRKQRRAARHRHRNGHQIISARYVVFAAKHRPTKTFTLTLSLFHLLTRWCGWFVSVENRPRELTYGYGSKDSLGRRMP